MGVPALSKAWHSWGTAPAHTIHSIPSHPVLSNPIPSGHHPIPSHPIPSRPISSGRVPHSTKTGAHMYLGVPALSQAWHSCGTAPAHIHPIPSHPVPSNPIPAGHRSHPIPSHPIPSHLVRKGAAAYHGRSTPISGCASTFQGVALLRHSSSAHNTSHPISSVLSNPIPAGHHPIPSHPIPSHLVWKGAAFCQDWGAHVSGCASPFPGVALLRHSSGAHTSHPISSRPVQSHPGRSPSHPIPSHPIPCHLVRKGAAAYHGRGTHISGCASSFQGVALLRHSSGAHNTLPSHLIPSCPIPSRQVTIPSHPIPSHPVPSRLEGCRILPRPGHTCIWVCQPFPRRGTPAAQLRRTYIPSHLIPSRPIPSRQVTVPSHPIPSHTIPSSPQGCRSLPQP